jgi:antitoxin component YwqK of YwqJK toxin-antitoxin module/peroxiredoxin
MLRTILLASALVLSLHGCSIGRAFLVRHEEKFPDGPVRKEGNIHLLTREQEGPWTFYYNNGKKRAEGLYTDDVQDGRWTYYYKTGAEEMEGSFAGERRVGPWRYFSPSGAPRAEGFFDAGQETGYWMFYTSDDKPDKRGQFSHGKPTLRWTYWYPDGSKKAEGYRLDGERVGTWRYWQKSGEMTSRFHPMPEGYALVLETWEDGSARREGYLRHDVPTGLWLCWHRSGKPRLSVNFDNGVPDGFCSAWRSDGSLLAAGTVAGGRLAGAWTTWEDGQAKPLQLETFAAPSLESMEGGFSRDDLPDLRATEDVVRTWIAEASSHVPGEAIVKMEPPPAAPAPAPDLEKETERAPVVAVRAQPELTVLEKERLADTVDFYANGASRSRSGSGRYRPVTSGPSIASDDGPAALLKGKPLPVTRFRSADDRSIELRDLIGKKSVLLVILRGYAGGVCMYCAAQTKALGPSLDDFKKLNTEVFVVYPGPEGGMDAFKELYRNEFGEDPPPYTLLYDVDLALVEGLGIKASLAFPSALIVDRTGSVVYAYVGQDKTDRPPVKDLLEVLKGIQP